MRWFLILAPLNHLCAHLGRDPMSLCYPKSNSLTLFATPTQPIGTVALDPCQLHLAGEDHLVAQGYQGPVSLPYPVYILRMDHGPLGGQSCLYVPLLAWQNNWTILTNVARHAQWKLNCLLQKQLCDDQLPNQIFYGSPRGQKRTKLSIWWFDRLGNSGWMWQLVLWGDLPES